jgi:hypothetical protein
VAEQLTLTEEAFALTLVDGESLQLTLDEGDGLQLTLDGGNGPSGPAGAAGAAGPNTVTTSTTAPSLVGYIFGNGTTIAGSTAAATAATANTLVLRTGTGAASFTGITNNGLLTLSTGTTFSYGTGIAAAHRTALGLGTLATQSGTFSGTSSGTNTGDQDLSGLLPKLSTLVATGVSDSMGTALTLTMVEQSSLVNGRRSWLGSGATLFHDTGTGAWRLEYSDIDVFYAASIVSDSQEPWKLTGWTEEQGSGPPNFSLTPNVLLPVQSSSGTLALTQSLNGEPDKLTNGYISGGTTVDDDATWNYGTGSASTHRTALGSGATGDQLFTADTPAAARETLEILTSSVSTNATATTQNVWVSTGASLALTTGNWRVTAFYHGANATSSATNVRLSCTANWTDTNTRRIATYTGTVVGSGPTYVTGGTSSAANFGSAGSVAGEIIAVVKMTGSGTLSMQFTNTAATGTATCYSASHLVATRIP